MEVTKFDDGDAPFVDWMRRHPKGYVLNTERGQAADYARLHRSGCPHITAHRTGSFTKEKRIKVCAESTDALSKWVREHRPRASAMQPCQQCEPMADHAPENATPFEEGKTYHRRQDLHARYGGQQQGGISTPADFSFIFLFTGKSGSDFGYRDEFRPDGTFWYTGEGQYGDMEMKRGNRAIRYHQREGTELHLFETTGRGEVRYLGEAVYLGHHREERPDADGERRQAIVFELAIEPEGVSEGLGGEEEAAKERGPKEESERAGNGAPGRSPSRLWTRPMEELRALATQRTTKRTSTQIRKATVHERSDAVKVYVLRRAEGRCEGCGEEAPFRTKLGRPYLESHHTTRVADGGPDQPRWVIALCPNCHRRVHHGKDGDDYNAELEQRLAEIEADE